MKRVILLLLFILGMQIPVYGDGVIIPEPVPPIPRSKPLYLKMPVHKVRISVKNNVALVSVSERFKNPYLYPVEGDYIFPLPSDAAISDFSIVVNDRRLKGEILERDKARELYLEYLKKNVDPALLEYFDDNLFRARIAYIYPQKSVQVNIGYQHIIPQKGNLFKLEYPLKIDALINGSIKNINITVTIEADNPIGTVFSPTHEISKEWINSKKVRVTFKAEDYTPESDFVLYYSVSRKPFSMSLVTYKRPEEDGFFMLNIFPGHQPADIKPIPKDIVFVFDISGSMEGRKIEQAKEGLSFMLNRLNRDDRFNIVAFESGVITFQKSLVSASRLRVRQARDFVKNMEAGGLTNINEALLEAVRSLSKDPRPHRARYILFLTDGRPTAGVVDGSEIVKNIRKSLKGIRIFVFGVGYDVNTRLLDRLAEMSDGSVQYINENEDVEYAITNLYKMIQSPALIDVKLTVKGVKVYRVYPEKMPHIYYGNQLVVTGRYKCTKDVTALIQIRGRDSKGVLRTYRYRFTFPYHNEDYPFVARLWARRRIGYLLTYIDDNGENYEVVEEIKRLGETYGIVTPYTSFLLAEEPHRTFPFVLSLPSKAVHSSAGNKRAFERSKLKAQYKYKQQVADVQTGHSVKKRKVVNDKTFRYDADTNMWIDTEYNPSECIKTIEVKYGSDKFIRLLQSNKKLAVYLSVGKNVIITLDGKCYKIRGD